MSRSSNLNLVTQYRRFASVFLQRRVNKLSVPLEMTMVIATGFGENLVGPTRHFERRAPSEGQQ